MKQTSKQTMRFSTAIALLIFSVNASGQIKQPSSIINVSQVKIISPTSFNKSLSPKYLEATKKFMTSTTKSVAGSAANSTVTLNRGGTEGTAPSQTTMSTPVQTGDYTCVTRNVNERTDYFRQPIVSQLEFIYPGALLNATQIINNQLTYYIPPPNYQRRPYTISADLFTMTGTPQSPSETIGDNEDYSLASFRVAKSLIMNRNAAANPPVEAFIEYIQANTQEEVAIKLGYGVTANIPPELVAMVSGVPVGVNANVSAGVVANQTSEKSRLILKINYNFYSMDASPFNNDYKAFISPVAGPDVPTNVVYVSSVLYGTTGYVYFESDKSASELQSTIEETVGVAGPLDQGSLSVNISAEARAKFASTVSKMVAYGKGLSLSPGASVQVGSLDNLLALIGSLRSWGPNNQGSPIAYTMNFINDGVQAVVSYSTQFPNKVCTQTPLTNLKFDVDLELESLAVSNVRDLDGTEDLYGSIDFKNLKANTKTIGNDINFFAKTEANANVNNFKNGTAPIDKRVNLISNLSFDELKNLEITLGGKLSDDEGILGSRVFKCSNCSVFSGDYGQRTLKFIELNNTQSSLNSLQNNGTYQMVKIGQDNFVELVFFESNNENDGKVRALFKVWVKPHS
ncbi:MAG: thiol-activated cytolysin family protein [Flavisolibacter sp.]